MPFAVSKWPYSPDPRNGIFGGWGWGDGAVPSWAWIMATTGATGPWTSLNGGIVVYAESNNPNVTEYEGLDSGEVVLAAVTKTGFQPPLSGSTSLLLTVRVTNAGLGRVAVVVKNYFLPNAIQVFGGFTMIDLGTGLPDVNLPNAVEITPALWNFEPI